MSNSSIDDKETFLSHVIDKYSKIYRKIKRNDVIILKILLHLQPRYFEKFKRTIILHIKESMQRHIDNISRIDNTTIPEKMYRFILNISCIASSNRNIRNDKKYTVFPTYIDKEPPFYIYSLVYEMHRFMIDYIIPSNEPIYDKRTNIMKKINNKCNIIIKLLIYIIICEEIPRFDKITPKMMVRCYESMIDYSMTALNLNINNNYVRILSYGCLYINKFSFCFYKTHKISANLHEDLLAYKSNNVLSNTVVPTTVDLNTVVPTTVVPTTVDLNTFDLKPFEPNYRYRYKKILDEINNIPFIHYNYIHKGLNELLRDAIKTETHEQKESRLNSLFPSVNGTSYSIFNDIIQPLQKTIDYLRGVNSSECEWFKYMAVISEHIPISITISAAKKEYSGFPLLYVNRQFEKDSGYLRECVIGRSCKFMQPNKPIPNEEIQNRILTNSLEMPTPLFVIVTNIRFGGMPFYHLLSLNPIVDVEGNYLYVICIQTPITTDYSTLTIRNIQNIIDLMYILT